MIRNFSTKIQFSKSTRRSCNYIIENSLRYIFCSTNLRRVFGIFSTLLGVFKATNFKPQRLYVSGRFYSLFCMHCKVRSDSFSFVCFYQHNILDNIEESINFSISIVRCFNAFTSTFSPSFSLFSKTEKLHWLQCL